MSNNSVAALLLVSGLFTFASCTRDTSEVTAASSEYDLLKETVSTTGTYAFDSDFGDVFTQSTRWESSDADITLSNGQGQLTANSDDTSQALEAWKLFNVQMPYNRSWEISVDVTLPRYWDSHGGQDAQVGAGIFVGRPVDSGQSAKVYECNFAVVSGAERFVQAQLVANRLGDDPIDVQQATISNSTQTARLSIQFSSSDKTLTLFFNNEKVGTGTRIDNKGIDNWKLSDADVMDVGIMGFAENTTITTNPPTLDNFEYRIY